MVQDMPEMSEGKEDSAATSTLTNHAEPFKTMALDIVGPFERSKLGCKFVLTAMCLVSKYPEAITLKDIRA